jgi:hypothetical protein
MKKEIKKDKAYFENKVKEDFARTKKFVESHLLTEQYKEDLKNYTEALFPKESEEAARLITKLIKCVYPGHCLASVYIGQLQPWAGEYRATTPFFKNIKKLLRGKELTNNNYAYLYRETVPVKVLD